METWKLILTPKLSGSTNMQYDLKMFYDFEEKVTPSVLRIYSWQPKCISLGYSQKIEEEIDVEKAKLLGWDVVRRPTGGGIVFHNTAEVTYSLVTAIDNPLLPKGLVPSYKKISEAIAFGLNKLGVGAQLQTSKPKIQNKSKLKNSKSQLCFSYPAEYEIVVGGKKIVGAAQKRGRRALLQQGSIFVQRTDEKALSVLKRNHDGIEAVSVEEVLGRKVGLEELSEALAAGFEEVMGVRFVG